MQIQIFKSKEFGRLEVLMIGDKPHFPATECAKILGYANPNDAIRRHCRGCVKHDLPSSSGIQAYNFRGLTRLERILPINLK
jgi:prophage antirepressor-like protein